MRSSRIIVDPLSLDGFLGVTMAGEHVLVLAFVVQPHEGGLVEGKLRVLARGGNVLFEAALPAVNLACRSTDIPPSRQSREVRDHAGMLA